MAEPSSSLSAPAATHRSLEEAVARFQAGLSDDERRELGRKLDPPTADDVSALISKLNAVSPEIFTPIRYYPSWVNKLRSILSPVGSFCRITVDAGMQPEVAALVWAIIEFTMNITVNYKLHTEFFALLYMEIRRLRPFVDEYRQLYFSSPDLQHSSSLFIASILDCCNHIVKVVRILDYRQRISFDGEFKSSLDNIRSHGERFDIVLSLAESQADLQHQKVQIGERRERSMTRRQLLDSLSTYDYMGDYKQGKVRRHVGTTLWVFETLQFHQWMKGQSHVLCCSGRLGSGKTVVTSSIIDHILNTNGSFECTASFFFCRYPVATNHINPDGILRSILRQRLEGMGIPGALEQRIQYVASSSTSSGISELLCKLMAMPPKAYILIDGLHAYHSDDRNIVLQTLSSLVSSSDNVRLFITSRTSHREEVGRHFKAYKQLTLDCESTNRDIEKYIETFLQTRELRVEDPTLVHDIKSSLMKGAEWNFLWVFCKLHELQECLDDREIRAMLDKHSRLYEELVLMDKRKQLTQIPMDTSSKYTSVYSRDLDGTIDESTRLSSEMPQDKDMGGDGWSEYTSAIPQSQAYIKEFVCSLFEDSEPPDVPALERIAGILPNLLQGFALSIGREHSIAENLEVMKFIHGIRSEIIEHFVEYYIRDREDEESLRHRSSEMSLATKMRRWFFESATEDPNVASSQPPPDTVGFHIAGESEFEDEGENDGFEVTKYGKIVAESAAFRWLRYRLDREIAMNASKASAMHALSSEIREVLHSKPESRLISKHRGPTMFETIFTSTWNPLVFVREQEYVEEPGDALARAIVLVQGVDGNTQALSCAEYLSCTWKMCGEDFMRLVQQVVQGNSCSMYTVTLFDSSRLTAWLEISGCLSLKVVGLAETTAEVGEMYGWMTIALSECPTKGYARAVPILEIYPEDAGTSYRAIIHPRPIGGLEASNGHCWLELFRNPTIVYGFPVRCRRPEEAIGLEVSLSMLAELLGTNRLAILGDLLILRGFCTMVVPTSYAQDTVYWHVLFNEDGGRIASTDTRVHDVAGDFRLTHHLMPSALETRRHIVGWCREMRNFAGTKEAQYKVRKSGLARPDSGLALDRINISGGKFLTVGVPIAIGKKDRPARAAKTTDYHKQLDWAGKQYVVLYDRENSCGWLVDGLSALLHLTRARLAYRRSRGQTVEFEDDDIIEAQSPLKHTGRGAAYALLTSEENMGLKIYMKQETRIEEISRKGKEKEEIVEKITRTWERLPDLVGDIYQTLGLLFDIQTDTKTLDGINFKIRKSPRRHLEGWDFHDVVADNDPLWPKGATLQEWGWGWVDLVRGINAIVLFGNGFGEIIRPGRSPPTSTDSVAEGKTDMEGVYQQTVEAHLGHEGASPNLHTPYQSALTKTATDRLSETSTCIHWATLPKKKELLATTTAVLDDIMNDIPQGDTKECLLQLHSGIYWHSPDRLFEECQCKTHAANAVHEQTSKSWGKKKQQEHICDRVQVLLPTRFLNFYSTTLRSPPLPLPENGAAIFGHSVQFRRKWPVEAGSTPRIMQPSETIEKPISAPGGEGVHEANTASFTSNSQAKTGSTSSRAPEGASSQTSTVASSVTAPMTITPADTAPLPRKRRDRFQFLLPGTWRKGSKG